MLIEFNWNMTVLKKSAQRVQDALTTFGLDLKVVEFAESTRTSQEAADAIGCELGQITKTLIFKGKHSHKPIKQVRIEAA